MENRGIVIKSAPRQSRKNRTTSDPAYLNDLLTCTCKLFIYAHVKRDFNLNHKTNRSNRRTTNKNSSIKDISIIDLMNEYLTKKDFRDAYSFSKDLLFIREFYRIECSGTNVAFSSFYNAFTSLDDPEFIKRYTNLTFANIANKINRLTGSTYTDVSIESDYHTILNFNTLYRSRN